MDTAFHQISLDAQANHGLATTEDLAAAGFSPKRRQTLVRTGLVVPVGHRGFRFLSSPRTERQRVLEACLEVGGVASHRTAAALHGLRGFELTSPIEVTVRDGRQSARATLARVHTTTWLPPDDVVRVDAIPTFNVARTLFSLAALVPKVHNGEAMVSALESAVTQGLATEAWLWWYLERIRRRGRNGVSAFEEVLIDRSGGGPTESWLERETLRVLRLAGLPLPECQARIGASGAFVARVDFRYRGTTSIIEVNGHRFHASREQLRRDAKRRRELVAQGLSVYDFTYDDVVQDPAALIAVVKLILGRAQAA